MYVPFFQKDEEILWCHNDLNTNLKEMCYNIIAILAICYKVYCREITRSTSG